jgi:glycosyltransferase involved in cell wall biosynthesis
MSEGITRNVHDLGRALERRGIDATDASPRVDLADLNRRSVHVMNGWRAMRETRDALEDPEVDLVHHHVGIPAMAFFARMARLRATDPRPLLVHAWNAYYRPEETHGNPSWSDRAYHWVFNDRAAALSGLTGADAVVVSSRFQARQLSKAGLKEPVHVVPNGVDVHSFRPSGAAERSGARERHGIDGDPVFLFYGHASSWKGLDVFVEALPHVLSQHPEATALVSTTSYGHGTRGLVRRLRALGVRDRVRLVGASHVPSLHAAADVAVVPPIAAVGTACHPNTLLECMASGLPVVASASGSIPEVIRPGVNGILADPGDPEDLAVGMLDLADDPAWRRRLGARARQDVVERFDWDVVAARMQRVYEQVLDRAPPEAEPVPAEVEAAEVERWTTS